MKLRIETCDNINPNMLRPEFGKPGYEISVTEGDNHGHVIIAARGVTKQAAFDNLTKVAMCHISDLTAAMNKVGDLIGR